MKNLSNRTYEYLIHQIYLRDLDILRLVRINGELSRRIAPLEDEKAIIKMFFIELILNLESQFGAKIW